MTQQHTPGPWTINTTILRDQHIAILAGNYGVAKVWNHEPGNNSRADAALIAAAPELLAALKEARDALNGAPNTVGLHGQINDAITKAEGGAS